MNLYSTFNEYWPLLALGTWLAYRWWSSRRVAAMLPQLKAQGATLLDVRTAAEFAQAHAPGSINIPLAEIGARWTEISTAVPVVVCCASGTRSGMARMLLKKKGLGAVYNAGPWTKLLD